MVSYRLLFLLLLDWIKVWIPRAKMNTKVFCLDTFKKNHLPGKIDGIMIPNEQHLVIDEKLENNSQCKVHDHGQSNKWLACLSLFYSLILASTTTCMETDQHPTTWRNKCWNITKMFCPKEGRKEEYSNNHILLTLLPRRISNNKGTQTKFNTRH